MKKKIEKKEVLIWIGILSTILIVCSNFLQMHYSSDTFVLYNLGYLKYPSEYFLRDGRIISTLFCYLGGILHLPIPVYIIAMDFIGMIFLSVAIYIMSKIFINIIKPTKLKWEILIYLAAFILILNQYTLEYLLFPESAVMCLGILFTVLAVKEFVDNDNKYKYLKIFLYLLLTGLSYQGELNIFPILAILVLVLKQIKEKKETKEFIKDFAKELIKLIVVTVSILVICLGIVHISEYFFGSTKKNIMEITNMRTFIRKLNIVLRYSKEIIINCINMFPQYSVVACVIISLIIMIITKAKFQTIVNYIFLVIVSIASVVLPLFAVTAGICARLSIPVMMIFGMSLIILIANVQAEKKKYKRRIVIIFTILLFIMNAVFIIRNTTEHIAANKVDENDGKTINYLIEKYEEKNNIKVTKFGYTYDFEPQQFAVGIEHMQSLTERKLACSWCVLYAMDYYCQRDFELVQFDTSVLRENEEESLNRNGNRNYEVFSDEQIIFKDDTIYMIIY